MKTDRNGIALTLRSAAARKFSRARVALPSSSLLLLLALLCAASLAGCQSAGTEPAGAAGQQTAAGGGVVVASQTPARGADQLITAGQVGRVRLGMSVREVKALFPAATFRIVPLPDLPAVVSVKDGATDAFYFSTDRMDETDGAAGAPRDEDRLTLIVTGDARHRTAEGIGPGSSLDEAVKAYGPVKLLYSPDAEYAKFAGAPAAALGFRVSPAAGQKSAGVYRMTPDELKDGYYESSSFHPGSKIAHVSVNAPAQAAQGAAEKTSAGVVAAPFRALLPKLKGDTKVAVLLPGELPPALAKQTIYASGGGDANGYEIKLSSRPDCGANSCFIGLLEARRGEQPSFKREVRLAGGVTGRYQPLTCGGSCSPPVVEWVSEGVLYRVQLDVQWRTKLSPEEEERLMIAVADSAIKAGAR